MKLRLRRFNPWSLAKMLAKLYFFLGVILSLLFTPFILFAPHKESENPVVIAVTCVLMFLIAYPIIGFITGVIGGYLYNFVSGKSGGIEVEVDNLDAESASGQ